MLGTDISFPVMLACPGTNRIWHHDGEKAAAIAAERAGTINIAAMGTGHPVEEVRAVSSGPLWQQIYMSRGREGVEEVDRAITSTEAGGNRLDGRHQPHCQFQRV